jgi:hypothetical protein
VSGYTPPPGVYFLDTFVLYQGGGNLNPATGSRSSTRVTENFVADIAIVGGFRYALKAGAQEVDFSARWFHDFDVQNLVRGDLIYASFSFPL